MQRMLVDKLLGVLGMIIGLGACLAAARCLLVMVNGPGLSRRLIGFAGVGMAGLGAIVSLYPGYLLLRYRAERRTTAREIAQLAARYPEPLTPPWTR